MDQDVEYYQLLVYGVLVEWMSRVVDPAPAPRIEYEEHISSSIPFIPSDPGYNQNRRQNL